MVPAMFVVFGGVAIGLVIGAATNGDAPACFADPTRSFGAPIFERGGVRVADVLERFWAGDTLSDLVDEFGVPADQLEDVLRVASRRAA